jgi:hypothetical protein
MSAPDHFVDVRLASLEAFPGVVQWQDRGHDGGDIRAESRSTTVSAR